MCERCVENTTNFMEENKCKCQRENGICKQKKTCGLGNDVL
jgi:hypothetical protein